MSSFIKLSASATREYWEVPILFEDEHLLAVDKPARLLTSPDRYDPERPNLMRLLHRDIARGALWTKQRGLTYLANAHRLDFETSGVILLAKDKGTLIQLADVFGSAKPTKTYVALVDGDSEDNKFTVSCKLGPHPVKVGLIRVDEKRGKKATTQFRVLERFSRHTLLQCQPLTGRTHQIRVHLQSVHLPIVADSLYGGKVLLLSSLKPAYRQKQSQPEKPLISRVALHAAELALPHPATGEMVLISAPWPKDLKVAVRYLQQFAARPSLVSQQVDEANADIHGHEQQAGS
jgi:RluA family pseudouridine synthase